jgi:hypothetical protein
MAQVCHRKAFPGLGFGSFPTRVPSDFDGEASLAAQMITLGPDSKVWYLTARPNGGQAMVKLEIERCEREIRGIW